MSDRRPTRRDVLRQGLAAGTAAGLAATGLTAASYAQVAGANERIRIGMIGTGIRGGWHINWLATAAATQPVQIVAVCDIWRQHREGAAKAVAEKFGADPKTFADYRRLLDARDVDAVVIATPDHQHCTQLIDAVKAGKDVYVEKPIAMNIAELNAAHDAVKASQQIVQHGTQGRSCAGAASARAFLQAGKLGKLLRVEQSRSFYNPYWNGYVGPAEGDTDWKAFLFNRPARPFDADQCGAWMGYRDFSTGPVGGWMSHFSDLIHYVTGCEAPTRAVCLGGVYSPTSKKGRTCPDTVTAILEYPEGFTTLFTTHFGNGANDYMIFFGTKGIMRTAMPDGWPNGIEPRVSGDGSESPDKIEEATALENTTPQDHMTNWLSSIRSRKQPNADMDAGYKHGVAVLLADRAFETGARTTFDAKKREIRST